VLGLPALTMEFALGRASQASPVRMYQELEKPGSKWHIHGYVCLLGNIFLMAFYTVVTGWLIYYFASFVAGKSGELSFGKMISSPRINVMYLFIAVAVCFLILTRNLQSGLERITKYMMVLLLVLMTVLAVRSISLPGGAKGLSFYLVPDFKKLTVPVVVGAMIIFPACASFGIAVDAGPSLLFNTMTTVFNNMGGGRVWGSLFFLFMVFAAFSTELAVCENILACVREMTGWSRKKGCIICGAGIFLIALTTALGYSVLHFHPFGEGSAWLDFWDFIVSNNLLPLGALIFAVFSCSSRFGLGWEKLVQEANEGEGLKVKNWMKPVFAYFVPLCIIAIYIIGLATFKWK